MSGSDALLWTVGRDPVLRPTIVAVLALDSAPCWTDVRVRVAALVDLVPRLRSRAKSRPLGRGRPQFVTDDRFDLDLHLRRMSLPVGSTFRGVLDLAQVMGTVGFDPELPPWEAVVVEGVDGDGAALVIKLHHALVDGVGGVAVLLHLLDSARHPASDHTPVPDVAARRTTPGPTGCVLTPRRVIETGLHVSMHPIEGLGQAMATAASAVRLFAPAGTPLSPIMTERGFKRTFEALEFPVQALRQAATAVDGTLNDVFVAAVVRGVTLYHDVHGVTLGGLRALMPVNVRSAGDPEGGNHFVPARFVVPAPQDSEACVRGVQRIAASWKHAPGLALSEVLATGLDKVPNAVVTAMWGSMLKGVDMCITDIPGPTFETYLAGARVVHMYAFAPPSGAAVNVSLVTSADRASIGIAVDSAAVPDSRQLASCLNDGFEEVLHLGRRLDGHRP
ncbi:MAG: wax ester/triacylglycerol synthase domain-containing protein [Acidimicrobiales bacterium]